MRKIKRKRIYSPLQMTLELQQLGENYTKKEALCCYAGLFLLSLFFGILFQLTPFYMCAVILVYLLFVPQLIYNQKKQKHELRRFHDVNAYMSQMAQSFTSTKNILSSLQETIDTFPPGRMRQTLQEAIDILTHSGGDITCAQQNALSHLEDAYNCEKIRNLHEFLLMAETHGGKCDVEFSILEKVRMAWETAVSEYRLALISARNTSTFLYGFLLLICLLVMHAFPENLSIIQIDFIQVINTLMLVFYMLCFILMDSRINDSLLRDASVMSKSDAESHFAFVKSYSSRTPFGKFIHYPFFRFRRMLLKEEIQKAFPKWLFDIMLLIQRESIDSAIIHSVSTAPPVLQQELLRISTQLVENSESADAYMSFLADFQLLSIETSMRKLYSLSVGTGGNGDVMQFIIASNMDLLIDAEKRNIARKGDFSSLYQFLPVFIVSLGMLVYCVAIMLVSLSEIMSLFN